MSEHEAALRRAAEVLDVPGTPRTLRLDAVEVVDGGRARIAWSIADPEVLPGDRRPQRRRIRDVLEVPWEPGPAADVARSWWSQVQLAAGRRFVRQVDADWEPGVPYERRVWGAAEAWQALLDHLRGDADELRVEDGDIHTARRGQRTVYRIDPDAWARYLTGPEGPWSEESEILPVGPPMAGALPVWVVDELDEVTATGGPFVGLVAGRLVGLTEDLDG